MASQLSVLETGLLKELLKFPNLYPTPCLVASRPRDSNIAPCARAPHSPPALAHAFLLSPSLPIAQRKKNKKILWRRHPHS